MLKFDEICQLVELVGHSGVARVDIENEGFRIQIDGRPAPVVAAPVPVADGPQLVPPQLVAAPAPTDGRAEETAEDGAVTVTSPIVGTFYRAPNPEADPYVKVGDVVSEGQVMCIVEAMKLMNEIEAEIAGTVVKVYPENGAPVEFGQPLFAIRPA
ncbi:MAG: acetyl-CoA carboxylase biotin carboxyl carrier protein [Oceanicaulis sp.]|jgi:acetyl-CoA carboxylase biotin carboxyl carrier protein|nr:acetyl-CoA carboxylase biotin carboxyl carrier protein [Oceanicaulis sp.]